MANEVIKRDENFRTVAAGVGSDSSQDITMFRVDPVTNYLLIAVNATTTGAATASPIASRDQNFRPVCLGYDASNNTLQEILTDANGNLLCDITYI